MTIPPGLGPEPMPTFFTTFAPDTTDTTDTTTTPGEFVLTGDTNSTDSYSGDASYLSDDYGSSVTKKRAKHIHHRRKGKPNKHTHIHFITDENGNVTRKRKRHGHVNANGKKRVREFGNKA